MISYDLAKELKNAGWPQDEGLGIFVYENGQDSDEVYAPSLSELIAACPKVIEDIKGWFVLRVAPRSLDKWITGYHEQFGGWILGYLEEGSTPEEAVTRLWLKLKEGKV